MQESVLKPFQFSLSQRFKVSFFRRNDNRNSLKVALGNFRFAMSVMQRRYLSFFLFEKKNNLVKRPVSLPRMA